MQLSAPQLEPAPLAELGEEVRQLLFAGEIDTLAARFGYALAFDRKPANAIRETLGVCLSEIGSSRLIATGWAAPRVSYFKPNDTGLLALVECNLPTDNGKSILVELIVAGSSAKAHATLEQISAAV